MIDGKTKQKLLDEIQKFGNVYSSCLKVGVDKATYYRWKKKNIKFYKKATDAEKIGRSNISDVAEHALLINVKKGEQRAIEYALNHNSETYRRKTDTNVYMYHKKDAPIPEVPPITFEDLIDEYKEGKEDGAMRLLFGFRDAICGMPTKPDGTEIGMLDVKKYETYIRDWQAVKLKEMQAKGLSDKQ